MNIKIEITKEELEKYIQYERLRHENPCYIKCAGPGGLLWMPRTIRLV